MANYRLDILGLSEVRWKGQGEYCTIAGYHLLYSGNENNHINGVAILLTPNMKRSMIEYKPISDRLIMARFKTKYRNIIIFQCYAPTEVDDDDTKNAFYEQLDMEISRARKSDLKLILGDMNAKVGTDNRNLRFVMGTQGLGSIRNDNGERLVDLCAAHQLFIGGTKFPHRDIHKYTWRSPDKITRNQIDHILISRKFLGCLMDVRTFTGADIYSDHQLLVGVIKLRPKASYHNTNPKRKFNVHRLQDPSVATEFSNQLSSKLNSYPTNTWSNVVKSCYESAEDTLGFSKRHVKPWISDASWQKIDERKLLKLNIQTANNPAEFRSASAAYNNAEKQVKKSVRNDKRQFYNEIASAAENAASRGDTRAVYSAVRQLSGEKMRSINNIKDENGVLLTTSEDQMRRWKEFFEAPIMQGSLSPIAPPIRRNPRRDITISAPTLTEVKNAITKLKNNKAAGPDNLPSELFKSSPTLATYIWPLIQEAWCTNNIPTDWKEGVIVTIPKKGDLSDCRNWRGITLQNTIQKILSFIILDRISPSVESCLRKEQAGFRRNRSCVDHINSLRIIVEQSAEWNNPLYLTFVDFERAFDSIDRGAIWYCLQNIGIPDKIITIIQMLYDNAKCKVRFKGLDSEAFLINCGVKQGCVLSPLLFLLVLDSVLAKTNIESPNGIQWTLSQRLHDLDYADDLCLMSHTLTGIQDKVKKLFENALKVGLKINFRKTKSMRMLTNNYTPITVNGNIIEDVSEFSYLGSIISTDGGADADVSSRINKARHAYASLGRVWQSAAISKKHKIRIFNSSVKSVLLYGSETWKVTNSISHKLQTFLNKCLRCILKIFWPLRISNKDLLNICGMDTIDVEIRRRKWRWIGHTLRKENSDIAKVSFQWNPQGFRNRGRPRITWRRSVEAELLSKGLSWPQIRSLAHNRVLYRNFVNSF